MPPLRRERLHGIIALVGAGLARFAPALNGIEGARALLDHAVESAALEMAASLVAEMIRAGLAMKG